MVRGVPFISTADNGGTVYADSGGGVGEKGFNLFFLSI